SSVAAPILIRHRVPCIFFIVSDCIDNRHMMYRHKASLCVDKAADLSDSDMMAMTAKLSAVLTSDVRSKADLAHRVLSLRKGQESQIDRICEVLGIDWRLYLEKRRPYLTQGEIKSLAAQGFKIGAHTRGHPRLADLSPAEIEAEIVGSCH